MSGLIDILLTEVLRDTHAYVPGIDHTRPTLAAGQPPGPRTRERVRDALERAASTVGFSRRHFDPDQAAPSLRQVLAIADRLEATYGRLADDVSRRAMIDVLKLRVLGPYHSALELTPESYRRRQALVERDLCLEYRTLDVPDPWFSPLSLYRAPLPSGASVKLHTHSVSVVSLFLLHQYRHEYVSARPGDVVLDIGGCWGDSALYLADQVGPSGKVYTFEFEPRNVEVLRTNLSLNPELARRIEIVELAVWERSGERLPFVPAGATTTLVAAQPASNAGTADTITVDEFAARAGITGPAFIKMDVEGAERSVLLGAAQTLRTSSPRLAVAAYHRGDDLARIPELIEDGYALHLRTCSPLEDETVLFATPRRNAT